MDVPQKHKGKKRVVTIYGIVALLIVVAFLLTLSTSNAALTMAKKSKLANETEQVQAAVAVTTPSTASTRQHPTTPR